VFLSPNLDLLGTCTLHLPPTIPPRPLDYRGKGPRGSKGAGVLSSHFLLVLLVFRFTFSFEDLENPIRVDPVTSFARSGGRI
jgi:hypothetical protein